MKVCIVLLRKSEHLGPISKTEDLSIAYLAAVIERTGKAAVILDQSTTSWTDQEVIREILDVKPDLIVYQENRNNIYRAMYIANRLREKLPNSYQVISDRAFKFHATTSFHAEEVFQKGKAFDAAIIGECEQTLMETIDRLASGQSPENVPGLMSRVSGSAGFQSREKMGDINRLPWPMRYVLQSLTPNERRSVNCPIVGSRGCPQRCSFCLSKPWASLNKGKPWRGRDPSDIVNEMEHLFLAYGVRRFSFFDANWTGPSSQGSRDRILRFSEEIVRRKLDFSFDFMCRVDFFRFPRDENLIQGLQAAGLHSIFLGVENGNPDTLLLYGKGGDVSPELIEWNIQSLRDRGILLLIGFIMFHPFVTFGELDMNLDFLCRIKYHHYWSAFSNRVRVFRHCGMYYVVKNAGLLRPSSKWGEQDYRFVVPGMEEIYQRVYLAGHLLEQIDRRLDRLLGLLWYEGPLSHELAESLQKEIAKIYVGLWERLLRASVADNEILSLRERILDLAVQSECAASLQGMGDIRL